MLSPVKIRPKNRKRRTKEETFGCVEEEDGVVDFDGDEKSGKRGSRTGNPADWTRVAIHLLFPPLS